MQKNEEILSSGNYFKNQQLSSSKILAWSHRTRFKIIRKLLQKYSSHSQKILLDYGCGDGTFLFLNQDLYTEAFGSDVNPDQISNNSQRFNSYPKIRFTVPEKIFIQEFNKKFDFITCMEVLEHCFEEDIPLLLQKFQDLLTPSGMLLMSVPIETGLSLIAKQFLRRLAALRQIGDYQYMETYRPLEFLKMVLATSQTQIHRPRYQTHYGHKGFNFRLLKKMLESFFVIEKQVCSPLPVLGSILNSQIYFVCRKK